MKTQSREWFYRSTIIRNQDNQVCVGGMDLIKPKSSVFLSVLSRTRNNIIEQSLEWFHRSTISRNQDNQVCVGCMA